MIKKTAIILGLTLASASAFAASLSFNTPSDFYGKAGAIFSSFTKLSGFHTNIPNASGKSIPASINMSIVSSNKDPVYGPFTHPQGSIGWSADGHGTYTFTLFAGGKSYSSSDHHAYCIDVKVDGKEVGSAKCTDFNSNWDPELVNNVQFTQNSNVVVTITNQ